jgi:hypothetical protein
MAAIRLFGNRLSPFVEKVYLGLQLKKLPVELVEPTSPLDLRRWNPQTGKMPVLEMDGEHLYDSTFILRRIDERFPNPPLVSADPRVAAAQRQLEDWSDESLYWHTMSLRWCARNAASSKEQITATMRPILRPLAGFLLGRQIGRGPGVGPACPRRLHEARGGGLRLLSSRGPLPGQARPPSISWNVPCPAGGCRR